GISEAVARARLRRRRRRRAGPPAAGLYRRDPFAGELTRRLEWYALARRQDGDGTAAEARLEPGTVPVGERDREEVTLSFVRSAGLCLLGPRAREVARAITLTFLAEHDPDTGRAIVVGDLLPAATTFPGLGRTREVGAVLGGLQTEISRRRSLLAEAGAEDVIDYHAKRPGERLPLILVATAEMTTFEAERLRDLLADGAATGIVGLVVDAPLDGLLAVALQGPGRVAAQSGREGDPDLTGTRMFTVEREPAVELLEVLASARSDVEIEASPRTDESFQVSPSPSPTVSVKILGGYRIDAHNKEIRSGLRAKAKELLAFYLLHPEGTTLEEATEALWPEADARRGSEWFWTALGNLRSRLRSATEKRDLKVIERDGDRYRIEPVFDVDLWHFEAALAEAGSNSGDPAWIDSLQAAADLYTGELLAGFDWPWAEVPREDLRARAVDVLVSIAATRLVAGDVLGALDALERAVEVDPLAEQLYRRIMRLHAKLSRPDQADATFRALEARLGEIALEPTPESAKLHGELCGTA
ncbi:MAG: bacterial transcriptional activator domain-containing protein, partial [Actinomycetota bacterium]|nr:bacterial transcriptional activator domain-containing protein [Actinomycetota bacterium]